MGLSQIVAGQPGKSQASIESVSVSVCVWQLKPITVPRCHARGQHCQICPAAVVSHSEKHECSPKVVGVSVGTGGIIITLLPLARVLSSPSLAHLCPADHSGQPSSLNSPMQSLAGISALAWLKHLVCSDEPHDKPRGKNCQKHPSSPPSYWEANLFYLFRKTEG